MDAVVNAAIAVVGINAFLSLATLGVLTEPWHRVLALWCAMVQVMAFTALAVLVK